MRNSGKITKYKVGDVMVFGGGEVFGNCASKAVKYHRPETICRITSIDLKGEHPYKVRGTNLSGWVDKETLERSDA